MTADLTPNVYAEQLQDEHQRLKLLGEEGVDINVEASFGLSYARLTEDDARVFRRLAVFPATFDARAEERICEDPGHKHLSELLRRNLVRHNDETQRYSLHDLARLFADSRMSEDERRATPMRHASHYLTVLWECDAFYKKGGDAIKSGLALCDVERRNIDAGHEWACRHASVDDAAARLCSGYPNAGTNVLNLRQQPSDSILWRDAALEAARQLKDRVAEGVHLDNLGISYAMLGDRARAIEYYEQALTVSREIGNRRGEGGVLNNLGVAYKDLGEIRRAIEFQEQSLVIFREIGERRGEAVTLSSLGITYRHLGEISNAIEYHTQALVIVREIGDMRSECQNLCGLGLAYNALGELRRAVEFYEQALMLSREIGDKREEGITLFNISFPLNTLGDRAQAISHAEAALEIFDQIESPYAEIVRTKLAQWRGEA